MTWGIEQTQIRSQYDGESGTEPASVERVALNNQEWPAESRFRAIRFAEVGPPDLATLHYHDSVAIDRFWTRRVAESSRPLVRPHGRWHGYRGLKNVPSFRDVLREVERDPTGIFPG